MMLEAIINCLGKAFQDDRLGCSDTAEWMMKRRKFLLMQWGLAINNDGREENAEKKHVSNNGFW